MKKIKILEVNNVDLIGKKFNGYDFIDGILDDNNIVKQVVIYKQSNNDNVIELLTDKNIKTVYEIFINLENNLSIHNIFSISTPALMNLKEYKEADIIHFHMFHNTKLSLYSLIKISREKKVVLTLHDSWFLTGRCVHFYKCKKWENGCDYCEYKDTLFPFKEDNCNAMWKLKKHVFNNSNIEIIVTSDWMRKLVNKSPILEKTKNIHLIPFGIDIDEITSNLSQREAKKYFSIPEENIVYFLRAQNEFKGTKYILEALKKMKANPKLTFLTCEEKGLLDEVKNKFNIIDLGIVHEDKLLNAYSACDVFLMPSSSESFGLMAIEAMANSKPVIVFNNSALPSITHSPNCGYLVNDKDVDGLMKAILHLSQDKEERLRRGALGNKVCREYYSRDEYYSEIKKVYTDLYNKSSYVKTSSGTFCNKDINYLLKFNNVKNLKKRLSKLNLLDFHNIDNIICIDEFNFALHQKIILGEKKFKIKLSTKIKRVIKKNEFVYSIIKKIIKK